MSPDVTPKVTRGYVYPIKSCAGIEFGEGDIYPVNDFGPEYDREWMVVGAEDHVFRTQRDRHFERLVLVRVAFSRDRAHLVLSAENMPDFSIPLAPVSGEEVATDVHTDPARGVVHCEASEWMSDFLREHCLLIRRSAQRFFKRPHLPVPVAGTFADGAHLLGASESSLAAVNALLEHPITMENFRPNLVFDDCSAREENHWAALRIDGLHLNGVKPCDRCPIVNVDPRTAERRRDVLKAITQHFPGRKQEGDRIKNVPIFGEHFMIQKPGPIHIGSPVEVLERREEGYDRLFLGRGA